SVIWVDELQLWLMTYNGVYFHWAKEPWGPWSPPQQIFALGEYGAGGTWVQRPSSPLAILAGPVIGSGDPMTTPGAAYGPYMIEAYTRLSGDILTVYWLASTWNPYSVILMRSDFRVEWAPAAE